MEALKPIVEAEQVAVPAFGREPQRYLTPLLEGEKQKWALCQQGKPVAVLIKKETYDELLALLNELKGALAPPSKRQMLDDRLNEAASRKAAISLEDLGKKYGLKK